MDDIEEAFREGLRDAVSSQPALAPIELDEVMARAELPIGRRRSSVRWIGLAAAVIVAAGLGLWAIGPRAWAPVEPRGAGTPGAGTQVRTLRVHNETKVVYHQAALQLADGRRLSLGDVPAGGTVLVPMDGTSTIVPLPSASGDVAPRGGWRVIYSGDCGSGGQLVAVVETGSENDEVSIQVVAPSDAGTSNSSVRGGSGATPGDSPVPTCSITITTDPPSPEPTPKPAHT